ncbi:MAG: 2Fe-2S iron-sulfur cluster-binding protein [Gammaproteobacteria bacterium]|nr:2Fe-2S iron-sulfur cluster-binding protein [Gammaproteobacteria bacterium]
MRLFSYKDRPFHLGPYPLETLRRRDEMPDLSRAPAMQPVSFHDEAPESLANAMRRYEAMLDAIRDGLVKKERASIPGDLEERSNHLKSFGYYQDAGQAGVCRLDSSFFLSEPVVNPDIEQLAQELRTKQTKTLAAGIDMIMAELKKSMDAPPSQVDHHTHALVCLHEYPRDPARDEPGCDWIQDCQPQRASLRAAETAVIISNYIRQLGFDARAHTGSASDVDLNKLAIAAGLAEIVETADGPALRNPYTGARFGLAAVTTTLELAPDRPLASRKLADRVRSHGPGWWLGKGFAKSRFNNTPYSRRKFKDGAYPFERSKRVDEPTTFIDEARIPRVPKRTDMFARAIFGDMGKPVQEAAKNGNFVRKSPASFAHRRPLGAFVLLQDGPAAEKISPCAQDSQRNADNVKAALYFLGADAVGISRCPDWVYYSHDAIGEPITPYHENAVNVIIDQGHETMEGASGDDWIACAQSMRAYLRFSVLGGVIGEQIRNLGYSARVHTVMDGEVLQPPLLLLSGLGEVSRIGEVILNPYLGPRLKTGVITTNMPLTHDKPVDFGLQNFCNNCNKCARECPSGAITAGPKLMFNGYETWKSDSQKCATYRLSQPGGAMCGRCMKTCPWNLEGLFAEAPFRWLASNVPAAAKRLAALDDKLGNGSVNPVKKWWWDIEMTDEGPYRPAGKPANRRELQTGLDLKYEDQTLAVYPANLAPHPYPYPAPMDREKGIKAYRELLTPQQYKQRLRQGDAENIAHKAVPPAGPSPVLRVVISKVEKMTDHVTKYEFSSQTGDDLPAFDAGAHIDVVVAPEYFRQYSLSGDPADRSKYQVGVLKEEEGRGGSKLLHDIFIEGRRIFISRPVNHFPLREDARRSFLLGGGIGITPMIAMGHRLHTLGREFELHYSCRNREVAGFLRDLADFPWFDKVHLHFSQEGSRADLDALLSRYEDGYHLYTCGSDRYMKATLAAGERWNWPEEALHKEYFSIPEAPQYENHPFTVKVENTGQVIEVGAHSSAAEALLKAGIHIDMKCSDGLCGVCGCRLVAGEVEHRDYVLSKAQREHTIITCQSRAQEPGGEITISF